MAGMVINVAGVGTSVAAFPLGCYEAEIKKAELDVAKSSGQPKVNLELEIYHPTLGTAKLYDNLPYAFPAKVKSFWMALNDLTNEEIEANPEFEVIPEELVGAQLIVELGEQESYKTPGKMVKTVVFPFYYPLSRRDVLDNE